jgi:hypothetical protein
MAPRSVACVDLIGSGDAVKAVHVSPSVDVRNAKKADALDRAQLNVAVRLVSEVSEPCRGQRRGPASPVCRASASLAWPVRRRSL